MSLPDFFIGFFLMNAMPHFVLGVWRGRMMSAFGFSPVANIVYGGLNFTVASSLFLYHYGPHGIAEHGIFAGAFTVLAIYLLTAHMWHHLFVTRHGAKAD